MFGLRIAGIQSHDPSDKFTLNLFISFEIRKHFIAFYFNCLQCLLWCICLPNNFHSHFKANFRKYLHIGKIKSIYYLINDVFQIVEIINYVCQFEIKHRYIVLSIVKYLWNFDYSNNNLQLYLRIYSKNYNIPKLDKGAIDL